MARKLGYSALGGAAFAAISLALSPAFGAGSSLLTMRAENPVSLGALGSISSFTPTTKDPRLAAAYAKAALAGDRMSFRFTPTSGSMSGRRSITVLVRAGGVRMDRTLPGLGITPVAFNLDVSRGWRKFALPDSLGRKDLDPVAVETVGSAKGFALEQPKKTRFSTNILVDTKRELGSSAAALAGEKNYSVDLASSYSLTKNLNVTAGVRYHGATAARIAPLTDDRQDNQAVYLGTIFKF
ncbi:hypothetical protein BH10PSE12_BH10PSE12_28310 [soil metagenome]